MPAERRYTLHDVTGAMGEALKAMDPDVRLQMEREIALFLDRTVAALKRMPEPDAR